VAPLACPKYFGYYKFVVQQWKPSYKLRKSRKELTGLQCDYTYAAWPCIHRGTIIQGSLARINLRNLILYAL
jgi:hypothetical protein